MIKQMILYVIMYCIMNTIIQRLSFLQAVVVAPSWCVDGPKSLLIHQFPWCSSVDDMTSTLLMSCCNPDWISLCLVDLMQYFLNFNQFNIEVDRRCTLCISNFFFFLRWSQCGSRLNLEHPIYFIFENLTSLLPLLTYESFIFHSYWINGI